MRHVNVSHAARRAAIIAFACCLIPAVANAELRMPKIFTDHMVLQQEMPVAVWGWTGPGQKVTVSILGKSVSATAGADGKWALKLPAMKAAMTAAAPATLLISAGNEQIEFKDVLIGEVWLASGQSNMNQAVSANAIKTANHPKIRLFTSNGFAPQIDHLNNTVGWVPCTPESIVKVGHVTNEKTDEHRPFSEVAYHFAVHIQDALNVPVGIFHTSCGGSTAKAWTPNPKLADEYPFGKEVDNPTHKYGVLYQSRLRGAIPFTLRGVIWYQGEDDGRNKEYQKDFTEMIGSWRSLWDKPELPFYFAQIAPTTYAGGMLGVWEAQSQVMNGVPATGMAVSNDIYDNGPGQFKPDKTDKTTGWPICGSSNPHPPHRTLVAGRLGEIALAKTYGLDRGEVFGPMYAGLQIQADTVLVKFNHVGKGLACNDGGPLTWFELAGPSEGGRLNYVKAEARIVGKDTIAVKAPGMANPQFARFGWNALARHNLINSQGLPAAAFRTDGAGGQ